ncbi:hypothetical protein QFC21_003104 [Naganishia friedmannii]|uniref:Uncharacterized protein n=1 Tax=Naganishia friedmannii TaxID=89922 RepID=A0ACC2VRS1_9TREE|nr:hypothetical protein QFC21_003104 [Naganishia friedmannii]
MAHRVGTLSRRQKPLQNRTPLIVYKHEVEDALEYIVETVENAEGHKTLTALGVEKGEADHRICVAALGHAGATYSTTSRRTDRKRSRSPTSFAQAAAKPATQPLPAYHIPTPDASGQAKEAESLYGVQPKWIRPVELIRSSETVEQVSHGWGGLNYVMDERDMSWLHEFNSKEEGTSSVKQEPKTNGSTNGKEGTNGKSAKSKGKERDKKEDKDGMAALKISDDLFEYIMGMLELWTEKNIPMLHTDLAQLPSFDAVEVVFKETPPASFYPAYEVPLSLPSPPLLARMARIIFPYWQQRKEQRAGKSIIPQLNLSWSEENDPYICFRRRDKPVTRKTRNRDLTSSDRMSKVQSELTQAMTLARMVSERERQKKRSYLAERDIWQARYHVLDIKRKTGILACTPEEESLLFPTRNNSNNALLAAAAAVANGTSSRRQKFSNAGKEDDSSRSTAGLASGMGTAPGFASMQSGLRSGFNAGGNRSRAASPVLERFPPEQLAGLLAEKVERELKRKREDDRNFEHSTNLSYQPLPVPAAFRHFRCLPSTESLAASQSLTRPKPWDPESPEISSTIEDESMSSTRPNHQICFRLRRGRGGIIRLDRRMPSVAHSQAMDRPRHGDTFMSRMFPVNPLARLRRWEGFDDLPSRPDGISVEEEDEEAARHVSERWRYDSVQGAVGVGMGVTDDDQVVVDDYELKYIQNRMRLVKAEDLAELLPSSAALDAVHAALAQPPPLPQEVVFSRSVPVPPAPQSVGLPQQAQQPMPADPAMIRQVRQLGDQAAAAQARALFMQQQAQQQTQRIPMMASAGQQQSPTPQPMGPMNNQVAQMAQMVNNNNQQINGMQGNQTPRMNNVPVNGNVAGQMASRPVVLGQMPQIRRMGSNGQLAQMPAPANSSSPVIGMPAGMPSLPNGVGNGAPNGMPNVLQNAMPNGMNNSPLNLINMAAAARQGQISPQILQALIQNGNRMPNGAKFPSPLDNNGNGWLKMSS